MTEKANYKYSNIFNKSLNYKSVYFTHIVKKENRSYPQDQFENNYHSQMNNV